MLPAPPFVMTNTWSGRAGPPKSKVLTTGPKLSEIQSTQEDFVPTASVKSNRYSYAYSPSAIDPFAPLNVRVRKTPLPPVLNGTSSFVSLTRTEHDVLKTQLIAGAATFTIFSGAAFAASGIRKMSDVSRIVFRM